MREKAVLVLENEGVFVGDAMGHEGRAVGVMVCSAFAAGFPDLLTDPSYTGKLVCFTYPHVGNAGVVPDDLQGDCVAASAVVAREICKIKANRLGVETMDQFLKRSGIPAIEGVDTRTITEIVCRKGRVRAALGCGQYADPDALAREFNDDNPAFQPRTAGTKVAYDVDLPAGVIKKHTVVVYDFGVKKGFLRRLAAMGCAVRVVPADCSAEQALSARPDGVVLSGGPGLPGSRPEAAGIAAALLGKVPLWGVGVGAGILASAAGARPLVDGRSHFGVQPVGRVNRPSGEMTVQCHDFWIPEAELEKAGLIKTHFHLNDGSVEGFKCQTRRLMGVLFHPESEPGPHDSLYHFDRFHQLMRG